MKKNNKPAASSQPERTLQEPYGVGIDHRVYDEKDLEHVEDISDDSGCIDPTNKQPQQQGRRSSSFVDVSFSAAYHASHLAIPEVSA